MLISYDEMLSAPRLTPKLEDHPLSDVNQYIREACYPTLSEEYGLKFSKVGY